MTDTTDHEKARKDRKRTAQKYKDQEHKDLEYKDQELGMNRGITRRDFVNGVAVGIGALSLPDLATALDQTPKPSSHAKAGGTEFAPERASDYYPPAKTGMRGNHDGTFTFAHQLRDGDFWEGAGKPEKSGEAYDLVVVGGGISGLAAAYFYRKNVGPDARILILDNHDDFGGHAKRNEFEVAGRKVLCYGGTQAIESPSKYSPE